MGQTSTVLPTLGLVVPAALGVALSPFPVVAIVVILGIETGRRRGRILLAAWVIGLTAVTVGVEVITSGASVEGSGSRTGVGWVKLVLGAVFLLLALKAWWGRPRPGEDARLPGWVSTLEGADARRTMLLGLGLSAANPRTWRWPRPRR